MPKRFSFREMTLLMAPVLVIGAVGFWVSKRPKLSLKYEKLRLDFNMERPTTLEAFRGASTSFVVKRRGTDAQKWSFQGDAPFLEVQTPSGIQTSRPGHRDGIHGIQWDHELWQSRSSDSNTFRATLRTGVIPAGPLHFGIYLPLRRTSPGGAPFKAPGMSGKWRIDRAEIVAPNLAAMPRKPWVAVRSVKIIAVWRQKKNTAQRATRGRDRSRFRPVERHDERPNALRRYFPISTSRAAQADQLRHKLGHNRLEARYAAHQSSLFQSAQRLA